MIVENKNSLIADNDNENQTDKGKISVMARSLNISGIKNYFWGSIKKCDLNIFFNCIKYANMLVTSNL